jgi:transcriptional regulator with XRE-family HTH domain
MVLSIIYIKKKGGRMKKHKLWIDIKTLREERDWTQEETADKLGFSRSYLSSVENGKRNVSIQMMEAIIRVFNVKYDDFRKV